MGLIIPKLMGRWGNQAFQVAAAIGYARKYNIDYCIPKETIAPNLWKPWFSHLSNNCEVDNRKNPVLFKEKSFTYQELPDPPQDADILLDGYWQSWKYFDHCREDIVSLFGFDKIETIPNTCAIHYRATDYKDNPTKHPIITEEYLTAAVTEMFYRGYKLFLVFSDDIAEAKKALITLTCFKDMAFLFPEDNSEIDDLRAMASCSSQITANSSYSWWAAYLNPNPDKVVIMPRTWFGVDMPHDCKDLYLPNAIVI